VLSLIYSGLQSDGNGKAARREGHGAWFGLSQADREEKRWPPGGTVQGRRGIDVLG
jgi:hypothetical protein